MPIEGFLYVVGTEKGVREALAAVWKATVSAGWIVLGDYDFTGILSGEAAGNDAMDLKSIDICQADYARRFVQREPLTALCMPCNVLIYQQNDLTRIACMRPGVIVPQLFTHAADALADEAARVDRELQAIIDAAR